MLVDVFSYVSYLVVASGTAIYSEYNNILYIKCITVPILLSVVHSILFYDSRKQDPTVERAV